MIPTPRWFEAEAPRVIDCELFDSRDIGRLCSLSEASLLMLEESLLMSLPDNFGACQLLPDSDMSITFISFFYRFASRLSTFIGLRSKASCSQAVNAKLPCSRCR